MHCPDKLGDWCGMNKLSMKIFITISKTSFKRIKSQKITGLMFTFKVLVLNQAPRHKDVWCSGGIAPHILKLGTSQVNFELNKHKSTLCTTSINMNRTKYCPQEGCSKKEKRPEFPQSAQNQFSAFQVILKTVFGTRCNSWLLTVFWIDYRVGTWTPCNTCVRGVTKHIIVSRGI
jgi:hypothetical protein